jgi:hypothetical protein
MIRTNSGYRHVNGEVEGFSAIRFGQAASEEACLQLVKAKCEALGQPFDPDRIIKGKAKLTKEEIDKIYADWALVRNPGDPDPASGKVGFFG